MEEPGRGFTVDSRTSLVTQPLPVSFPHQRVKASEDGAEVGGFPRAQIRVRRDSDGEPGGPYFLL